MATPYLGEIRVVGFGFTPKGWLSCNGQLLPINQNQALFSLLGTTYGGDGKSNFALPNLQGSVPMHPGQGPGLSLHDLGETGGSDTVSLLQSEMPSHSHVTQSTASNGNRLTPSGNIPAKGPGALPYAPGNAALVAMNGQSVAPSGGDQPHNNLQPYLTLNFCIALQGVYPPRG